MAMQLILNCLPASDERSFDLTVKGIEIALKQSCIGFELDVTGRPE
jgi:hypothetical protein